MNDFLGLAFFILLAAGAYLGLRSLSKKRSRDESEFERGAEESASLLGAGVNALQGMLDPGEKKGKEAITEVKKGRYTKQSGADEDAGRPRGSHKGSVAEN